ncbi:MAG: hypothetical protein ABSH25_17125 [Syntrophorhabdales bacterium]|jgi:hypothetical protein
MEPPDAFRWPPITERTIAMDAFTIVCPDKRTSMVMKARAFNEELTLMSYLEIKDGKAFVTDKGIKKVEDFKAGLPVEVREALRV